MAMDLLQLTVLALNLATEHSMVAISGFVCDRIPGALSPLFGWIVFLCVYFISMIFIPPPDVQGVKNACLSAMGEYIFSSL